MLDGSARRFVVHSRPVIAKIIDNLSQRRGNFRAPAMVVIGAEAQGGVGDMEALFPCGSDDEICFFFRPPAMMFHVLSQIYLRLSVVCTASMVCDLRSAHKTRV